MVIINYAANAQIVGADPAALEAAVVKYNATSSPFVGQGRKLSGATSSVTWPAPLSSWWFSRHFHRHLWNDCVLADTPSDAAPVPEQAAPSGDSKGEVPGVDKAAPTTTLQIRLADGRRLTGARDSQMRHSLCIFDTVVSRRSFCVSVLSIVLGSLHRVSHELAERSADFPPEIRMLLMTCNVD